MCTQKLFHLKCHTEKPQLSAERTYWFQLAWKSSSKKAVRYQIITLAQLLQFLLQDEPKNLLHENLLACDYDFG